jgi:2-polyprenyl-6-methoxyphenol hydroxylase-like FAD-dependent oxidoreductase
MAIEDGMILARCLALEPDFEAAFGIYERTRKPRAEELVERSTLMADVFFDGPDKYSRAKD